MLPENMGILRWPLNFRYGAASRCCRGNRILLFVFIPIYVLRRILLDNNVEVTFWKKYLNMENGEICGQAKPSLEFKIHKGVYDRRPDIRAILHAHSPALVAMSIMHELPDVRILPGKPGWRLLLS